MDITDLILDDHAEQRRLFAMLEQIPRHDHHALGAIWNRLRGLLDTHAEAEEQFFYPRLMQVGTGANDAPSAASETKDAIKDHNQIRDTGEAIAQYAIGSTAWFDAVDAANLANSKHMAEEERQGLTDFRRHATPDERHALGVRFAAFSAENITGVKPVDKDPAGWVTAHQP